MDAQQLLSTFLDIVFTGIAATVTVWKIIKAYVDKELQEERDHRELADKRIEEKLVDNNEKVHVNMGKLELIDQRLQEHERVRLKEMFDLKTSLRSDLHRIEIQLERIRQSRGNLEYHHREGDNVGSD